MRSFSYVQRDYYADIPEASINASRSGNISVRLTLSNTHQAFNVSLKRAGVVELRKLFEQIEEDWE